MNILALILSFLITAPVWAAKISEYTEDASPTADDYVLTVDNASGTSKKVQLGNLPVSSGAAAFTDAGTSIYTTTLTDNVGIGTTYTADGKLIITGGNVGVGSVTPGTVLDVTGTVRSTAFTTTGGYTQTGSSANIYSGNVGVGTSFTTGGRLIVTGGNVGIGTLSPGKEADISGNLRVSGGFTFIGWTDPISDYHAAGTIATTTGTITTGTNSLVVASASGWEVGMGIAVANAGSGGTTELITTITNISGTTFTLAANASATATTQTVNHDDTAALQAAVNSGKNVRLRRGNYNITSTVNLNQAVVITGEGNNLYTLTTDATFGSNIWNRGTTNDSFYISVGYVEVRNININQATGITPTGGYAFKIGDGTATKIRQIIISYVNTTRVWGGLYVRNSVSNSRFNNIAISTIGGVGAGEGIYYSNESTAGDNFFHDINIGSSTAGNVGIRIDAADTNTWSNIKTTGQYPGLSIIDAASKTIANQRFVNLAIENGGGSGQSLIRIAGASANANRDISFVNTHIGNTSEFGIRITGTARNYSFAGGTLTGLTTGVSIETGVTNVVVTGMNFTNMTTGIDIQSGASNVHYFENNFASDVITAFKSNGVTSILGSSSSGAVGIGTTILSNKLTVLGSAAIGDGNTAKTAAPTNGLLVKGNVGIGTLTPAQVLDVVGTVRSTTGFQYGANVGIGTTGATCNCTRFEGGLCTSATCT